MRRGSAAWAIFAAACSAPPTANLERPPAASEPAWTQIASQESRPDAGAEDAGSDGGREEKKAPIAVTVRNLLRARGDGVRDLVVLLEPLGVERVAARIPPDHRCLAGVTMDEGLSETRLAVGCGLETATELIHRADTIVIKAAGGEPSTLLLPAAATVQWVSGPLDEPATGDGCAGVPDRKKPVFVSTTIRTDEAQDPIRSRSMYLLVPEFKATLRIGYTWRDYCHGTHDPHQQTYRVTCNSGENRSSVEAMIVGDALLFAARSGGYGDHHYSPLGGFRIPCGAKVSFPVVHRVDPEYSPPGPCVSACGTSTDLCRDRCLARYADRETEGSPGLLCLDRCRAQDNACSSRCR